MKASKGVLYQQGRIFWFAISVDGIRKRFSLSTSDKNEATELANRLRRKYAIGLDPIKMEKENITIAELAEKYLPYAKNQKAERTYLRDKFILDKFVLIFGGKSLSQISQEDIEGYLAKIKGLQQSTINREITSIKAIFTFAYERKLRGDNVGRGIKYYRTQQKPITWLTDDDIKKLLAVAPEGKWRDTIIVLLECGIRLGEFTGIRLEDIDLKNKIINIRATKTYNTRAVRITDRMLPIAEGWLKNGKPEFSDDTAITKKVRKIGIKAGVNCYPHLFRHTFASRLAMAGVPLNTVSRLMGHTSIVTTMRYAHLAPDFLLDASRTGYKF